MWTVVVTAFVDLVRRAGHAVRGQGAYEDGVAQGTVCGQFEGPCLMRGVDEPLRRVIVGTCRLAEFEVPSERDLHTGVVPGA